MQNFSRYGVIEINEDLSIKKFSEKNYYEQGLINGGVYVLNRTRFLSESLAERFSFETDYLQPLYRKRKMYGLPDNGYFIDIEIPEDYEKAQRELKISDP